MSRAARAYVADVERKDPKPARKHRAFTLHVNRQIAVIRDKAQQTAADAAAFDVMCQQGKRLKPPRMPENMPQVRSPGSRDLEPQRLSAEAIRWTGEGWRF